MVELAHIIIAYCLGSVCFGLLFAQRRGIDLRAMGSGNIGATNAGRAMGTSVGRAVMLLDMLKGALPVASAVWLWGCSPIIVAATGVAATLGHLFPLWFGFRGGKGAATAGGVLIAALPIAGLSALGSFVVAKRASGHASIGSLVACLVALAVTWWTQESWHSVAMVLALVSLVILRHHENIRRLFAGREIKS